MEDKFATYDLANNPNREESEKMKEHIREIERKKVELLGPDHGRTEEKEKTSFMQKLRRGSRDSEGRRASKDGDGDRRRSSATKPSAEPDRGQVHVVQHTGTDAPPLVVKDKE